MAVMVDMWQKLGMCLLCGVVTRDTVKNTGNCQISSSKQEAPYFSN